MDDCEEGGDVRCCPSSHTHTFIHAHIPALPFKAVLELTSSIHFCDAMCCCGVYRAPPQHSPRFNGSSSNLQSCARPWQPTQLPHLNLQVYQHQRARGWIHHSKFRITSPLKRCSTRWLPCRHNKPPTAKWRSGRSPCRKLRRPLTFMTSPTTLQSLSESKKSQSLVHVGYVPRSGGGVAVTARAPERCCFCSMSHLSHALLSWFDHSSPPPPQHSLTWLPSSQQAKA